MAFLSKGFVGLFPMATVVMYGLVIKQKNILRIIIYCLITIFLPVLLFCLLIILFPGLKENIFSYIHQQVIPAFNNQREITTNNHFTIILNLFIELSFPVIVLIFFSIRKMIYKRKIQLYNKNVSLFFVLIGLSASLPIIISLKQRTFYLIPSIPFFILAISILVVPYMKKISETLTATALAWIKRAAISILIFTLVFSVFKFGKYTRDENKLNDIYIISQNIPEGTVIYTTMEIWKDWGFVAYMSRIGYLSLDCDKEHDYFLIEKNDKIQPALMEKYTKMDLPLKQYVILKKKIIETTNSY